MPKRLVLVDGNALFHRAYHATPPLTTSKGELVNAVYGFTSLIFKAIESQKPDYLAVAWDMRAPTFRHVQYADYKGTRGPSDDALGKQYPRVHEVTKSLNIPEFMLTSFEADDLIGALTRLAVKKDKTLEVVILTGDRDIMQLIGPRVRVLMPIKTLQDVGLYGVKEFTDRFGFAPINLIDYKALAGDTSDNIPGVPGIGEVSATKLIQKYTTLENVYRHLDELPDRQKKLLEAGKNLGLQSKKLVTIETDIPIKLELKKCAVTDFDQDKVKALFEELEFKSLIQRIPGMKDRHSGLDPESPSGILKPVQDDKNDSPTFKLDQSVIPVLERMTKTGILIDKSVLDKMGHDLKKRLVEIEQGIYKFVGHEFNLNSPKQLAQVLFDELKLPVFKKTKTGRSTDEESLRELSEAHPAVKLLLEYRQLFKLVSTYIDALPKSIQTDGRIHSTFNVEGAATGRLSSTNPNLQNIPIRGDLGGELRKAFIAPIGKVLLGADYSQIELRILAHVSDDPSLIKAFQADLDIHALTASKIFKIPVTEVDKEQRNVGKTMNFATLYGQGPHALSRALGVDYATARAYIDEYFAQYPKVRLWMTKILDQGYKDGFVETIWGRRRYIPELQAQNRMMKSYGERAAVNHPIQGTQADIIKKAMVEISAKCKVQSLECQMILQVHDELVFECDPKYLKVAAEIVCRCMENAITLLVPIKVELKSGPSWGEMTPLKI